MYGPVQPAEDADPARPRLHRGRHRDVGRRSGPFALGLLVTALLLAFGIGTALLPTSFTGTGDADPAADAPARNLPVGGATPGDTADPTEGTRTAGVATLGGNPSPSPSAKPKPSPTRSAKPRPRPAASTTPSRRPATNPATSPARDRRTAQEDEVTRIVNAERADAGCGAVRTDDRLRTAARGHSQDMADNDYFSHDGRDGSRFTDRAERAGYPQPIGENIAKGQRTPADVMEAWMNSDGHRRNILNCDARAIGVGLAFDDNGTPVWTQVFGAV